MNITAALMCVLYFASESFLVELIYLFYILFGSQQQYVIVCEIIIYLYYHCPVSHISLKKKKIICFQICDNTSSNQLNRNPVACQKNVYSESREQRGF